MQFVKATKRRSHARVALVGPPGSGKTFSALRIMRGPLVDGVRLPGLLVEGARLAVIDTERGSASKYSDLFEFDVLELPSFEPDTYVKALYAAADAGYDGVIVDSLSHAWVGKGGALEQVDKRSGGGGSSFTNGWRDVTPMHNRMVEALLTYPGHLITTMRVKTEYVLEQQVVKGKTVTVPRKVGMAPVQRDGLEYEFDVVGDLNYENTLSITKSRCPSLNAAFIEQPGEEMGATLRAWLTDGADPLPAPKRPAAPSVPQKLPTQTKQAESAKPPAPPIPFDITKAMMAMASATTEEELDKVGATFGAAPDSHKEMLRQVFAGRRTLIRQTSGQPPQQPANDAAPVASPIADELAEKPAAEEAPPADPGWDAGLAALAQVTGFETSGWSMDDLLATWNDELQAQTDRKSQTANLGPWLAALKSKQESSLKLRQAIVMMSNAFNARSKELREPAQQQAAGGAA